MTQNSQPDYRRKAYGIANMDAPIETRVLEYIEKRLYANGDYYQRTEISDKVLGNISTKILREPVSI
jgi:hypothetical protein